MEMTKEQREFYNECLKQMESRIGDTKYYLPMLERFVKVTFKANALLNEIMDEEAVVEHTNKIGATNSASSPKARMFALFNEQAHKLAMDLGLTPGNAKPSQRKKATGKDRFKTSMKAA